MSESSSWLAVVGRQLRGKLLFCPDTSYTFCPGGFTASGQAAAAKQIICGKIRALWMESVLNIECKAISEGLKV